MIKGIGTDIVDIERIESMISHHGERFIEKIFTAAEIAYCRKKASPALHFAGRWAAKEAFYKALPLQCQHAALWKSMEVVTESEGHDKPCIRICSESLRLLMGKNGIAGIHVSISHEKKQCVAVVILV